MNTIIEARIKQSSADFVRLVWPEFSDNFGEIVPVETVVANTFAHELDTRAGVDNWVLTKDKHVKALASRVQWCDRSYGTFTVRTRSRCGGPTEYHKRRAELETPGTVSPYYVTQAYISADRARLLAACIALEADVIEAVTRQMERGDKPIRNADRTEFYAVPWATLPKERRDLVQPVHLDRLF